MDLYVSPKKVSVSLTLVGAKYTRTGNKNKSVELMKISFMDIVRQRLNDTYT